MKFLNALLILLLSSCTAYANIYNNINPPLTPDPKITAGVNHPVVDSTITQNNIDSTICKLGGYTNGIGVRNVSTVTKKAVFAEYGIDPRGPHGPYEVDHLVSLELGGSNDIKNLWPQSYTTRTWNAHVKDALENHLHALVCHKQISLSVAQSAISSNWIAAYQKYMTMEIN